MGPVVPILRILDVDAALAFYRDFLGFAVDFEHRFTPTAPVYMQVSRDGALLHLSEHYGDGVFGAHVRIEAPGIEAYQHALLAKRFRYSRPGLQTQEWGERSMTIPDPFGNRITFYERIDSGSPEGTVGDE